MLAFENTVVVFDLDDTLYSEADYQCSGVRYLGAIVDELSDFPVSGQLWKFYNQNPRSDFLDYICELTGWPSAVKESLLWEYRLHDPNISLTDGTKRIIKKLRSNCYALAIVTDGRIVSQTAKLRALELDWIPAYISEAWNSPKPEPKRFLEIQKKWPEKDFVYVGDNPEKDFLAPNDLGWITIGVRDAGKNIHTQVLAEKSHGDLHLPQHWVDDLSEILHLI